MEPGMESHPRWPLVLLILSFTGCLASGCGGASASPPATPGDAGVIDRTALEGTCTISLPDGQSERIDFGNVALASTGIKLVSIRNSSTLPWEVKLGAFMFGADAFSLIPPSQERAFAVPAGDSIDVGIAFSPQAIQAYHALLPIEAPTWCNLAQIELVGAGVERTLLFQRWIDFSYVEPGSTATQEFTLQNIGTYPITFSLDALTLNEPASSPIAEYLPFSITAFNGLPLAAGDTVFSRPRVLPPDQSVVTYRLTFRPGDDPNHAPEKPDFQPITGPHTAILRLTTDDIPFATTDITLMGIGGGPQIKTTPSARLDFLSVPIGSHLAKTVLIVNVGTDVPGTDLDNLRFRNCRPDKCASAPERPPEIVRADGTPSPDFRIVSWPPSGYRDAAGLEAKRALRLEVVFEPAAAGANPGWRAAELHIYSTDPDEGDYVLNLVGEAIESEPCELGIMPGKVDFGVIEPMLASETHTIIIKNLAPTRCLIYALDLDEATKTVGAFQLLEGAKENLFIEGGSAYAVPVRFTPERMQPYAGAVSLQMHLPHTTTASLPLAGKGGASCLVLAPGAIEFGQVRLGCSARARSVSLINSCVTRQVTIRSLSLADSHDDHFRLVSFPASFSGLASFEKVAFSITYAPERFGLEATNIKVEVTEEDETPFLLSLPVSGAGTLGARQTDRAVQDDLPMVDLLFVLDSGGSMTYGHSKFADKYDHLAYYAARYGIDFHIAAVTSDPGAFNGGTPGVVEGTFWPFSARPPERIVTSSLPASTQKLLFKSITTMNHAFGAAEWLIHPAAAALSPIMTQAGAPNDGFLREGASLHVVTVSDTYDHGPHELSEYQLFFQRLKPNGRFFFHGVIPVAPGACVYDGGADAANDPRVKTMIADTGGYLGDICTRDWGKTFSELSRSIMKPRNAFALSTFPDLANGIVVKVNGVELHEGTAAEPAWRYVASRGDCGAVVFEDSYIPKPGAVVELIYDTACE